MTETREEAMGHIEGEGAYVTTSLQETARDLVWKATPFGETEDGSIRAYLVPAGALHRFVGAAQSGGLAVSLRNEETLTSHPRRNHDE